MADKTENIKTRMSFDGEEEYKKACKEINDNLRVMNSEMKLVTAQYKDNADSTEALKAKQDVLKKVYDEQAKKVRETEEALKKCRDALGDNSEKSKRLETQLNYQKAAMIKTQQEIKKMSDEMENAGKSAEDMGKDVKSSGEQAEDANGKFAKFKETMSGFGSVLATGVKAIGTAAAAIGTAVVAGLSYSVSQADAAKGALNDFCAATGTAKDEAGQYKQVMENIYNGNYGEGFEDIADAMATVKQQAGDLGADELEKMTTDALTLRDTFDMDVAESTRAATQLMNQFGLSGEEAYNLIAQGAQNGLNQNDDLLDVINEYSNQYAQAGLSAEDMFNSIANGAETGVWSIDKMGDAFKEFSIRMNDGTANEYLTDLGLDADELVSKFQKGGESAKEAMGEISDALKNCDDETLQYTSGVGLMGTMWEDMGADACTALMDVEGQINKTTDAMGQINAVKYDTFGEAIQGAGRILQTSFIMPLGEQALPIFSDFANEISAGAKSAEGDIGKFADSFGTALQNLMGGMTTLIPQVAGFAGEIISGLGQGIVNNAPMIVSAGVDVIHSLTDGIVEAIPTLTESAVEIATTLLDGIMEMMPTIAEGAVQIVAGLAAGIGAAMPELLPAVVDTVATIAETLVSNVPLLIQAAMQLVSGLADGLVNALPVLIQRLPEIITAIIQALITGLPMIYTNAASIITTLADGLVNAIPMLIEAIPQIITAIVTGLISGGPQILAATGQLALAILSVMITLPARISEAIAQGIVAVVEWGIQMAQVGMEAAATFVLQVINPVREIPQKIYNAILGAVAMVQQWGTRVLETAKNAMNNVVNGIVNTFSDIGSKFATIGNNIVQGIWNGISSGWDWLKDQVSGLASSLLDAAKGALGINSPSKKFRDEVGVYMAQGIGVGFEQEMKKVTRQIASAIPSDFDIGTRVRVRSAGGYEQTGRAGGRNTSGQAAAGRIVVNQYIYANETNYAKQQKEAAKNFRLIARTV